MATGIQISSTNFYNHIVDITFFPDTGGTVNMGYQLIPYNVELDYVYGVYQFYVSADTKTCYYYVNNPDTNYLLQENYFTLDQEDNSKIEIT